MHSPNLPPAVLNKSGSLTPSVPDRFYGLDAARAVALYIGIVHHGIESFVTYVQQDWPAQDTQSSIFLDALFYVSHVFRMQAFFLMAGFFAHLLYHRYGAVAFLRNRAMRLLVPFLLFWPLLYGFIWQIWVWGLQHNQHLTRSQAVKAIPDYMQLAKGYPLMHLWFLYFLLLFCLLVFLVRPLVNHWLDPNQRIRHRVDRLVGMSLIHWWGSLALGLLLVGPMLGMRDWFGVDTSASGLIPRWAPFLVYGLYFTLGWFLHRQPHLLTTLSTFRRINLLLGSLLIVMLIGINLAYPEPTDTAFSQIVLLSLNTLYAFASTTTVMAFIGYMLIHFSKPDPRIRYLSDSAYWGYLVHLPLVVVVQILVAPYPWWWPIKLLLILGSTVIVLGLTYHYGVRNTWVGALLNGRRYTN